MTTAVVAMLRTLVPSLWGGLVAWLVSAGWITPEVATAMQGWSGAILAGTVVVGTALVYALGMRLRRTSWWPDVLHMMLFGSRKAVAPKYPVLQRDNVVPPGLGRQVE